MGSTWRNAAWAEFWIGQHLETKNDDRKRYTEKDVPITIRTKQREMPDIATVAIAYLNEHPKTSSYKLVAYLKTQGIYLTQKPAWRLIKKWRTAPDTLRLDESTGRYISTAYTQNVITQLGQSITPGYTKEKWRKDWNEKYGLTR